MSRSNQMGRMIDIKKKEKVPKPRCPRCKTIDPPIRQHVLAETEDATLFEFFCANPGCGAIFSCQWVTKAKRQSLIIKP